MAFSLMQNWNTACRFCRRSRWLIMALGIVVFCAWGTWGWFYQYQAYINDSPVIEFGAGIISDTTIKPFQSVVVHQAIKKFRNCPGTVRRYITGECGHHILYEGNSTLKAGFDGQLVFSFSLPDSALPGQCEFKVYVEYICNQFDELLHRQVFESEGIPFEVVRFDAPVK